ncbi:hypothetical protein C7S18_10280 [Ahniella affigens]|uniref:Uncharacterized protein n=2 Tax=Ahniella affigens TaxID=2021234 RepID=A0A2P1PRU7_9GAMM|nr:hypothetical protein C7S18_10280 [Ahniella affigens]
MNRRYIQKNDIVMKYLRGELSVAQQTEFEQFYLDDPDTLDELEAASALKTHLSRRTTHGARRWLSVPTLVCSAASLLLGIAVMLPLKFGAAPVVQPNIRTISFDSNRGADSVVQFDRLPGERLILLRLPIATSEDGLTLLLTRNGDTILETTGLASDYMGDVLLVVPAALFSNQPTLVTLRRPDGTVLTEEQISVN